MATHLTSILPKPDRADRFRHPSSLTDMLTRDTGRCRDGRYDGGAWEAGNVVSPEIRAEQNRCEDVCLKQWNDGMRLDV